MTNGGSCKKRPGGHRTPAAFEIVDANASVSNISFPDEDLDVNEVGGAIGFDQ